MQITLFGKTNESGFPPNWTHESVISLAGEVDLDLTRRPPTDGARLVVFHLFGATTIRVPSGRRISVGGLTLAGQRQIDVAPATGPDLSITVFNLFGGVRISEPGITGASFD